MENSAPTRIKGWEKVKEEEFLKESSMIKKKKKGYAFPEPSRTNY